MIAEPIDFVVLTGFLGSGKTTLLSQFLEGPAGSDTAVIVNEAGEIGLDQAILRESGGDVPMTMLANGCICCQMGSDLSVTIEALLNAPRPQDATPLRRIVLETSGLSKPGPILRQLAGLADYHMRVAVLATYDALRGSQTQTFDEAAAQWTAAHRIVVTKLDLAPQPRRESAAAEAAAINPLAEIVAVADRNAAISAAFAPLAASAKIAQPHLHAHAHHQHPRIGVRLLRPIGRPAFDDLTFWLDNLAGALGERLLRLKGLVQVKEVERPLLVQSVGTMFSAPRPFGAPGQDAASFLVVIARDLTPADLASISPAGVFDVSA